MTSYWKYIRGTQQNIPRDIKYTLVGGAEGCDGYTYPDICGQCNEDKLPHLEGGIYYYRLPYV